MKKYLFRLAQLLVVASIGLLGACKTSTPGSANGGPPSPAASEPPFEPSRLTLRHGATALEDRGKFNVVADERESKDGYLYVRVALPPQVVQSLASRWAGSARLRAHLVGKRLGAAALEEGGGAPSLWLRLVGEELPSGPLEVELAAEVESWDRRMNHPWRGVRVAIDNVAKAAIGDKMHVGFFQAFAATLPGTGQWIDPSPPAVSFMAARARWLAGEAESMPEDWQLRERRQGELAETMALYTGITSAEEALQHERGLRVNRLVESDSVPLADVEQLALPEHPWDEIQKKIGRSPVVEPLAARVPADVFYVHFKDLRSSARLSRLLEETFHPVIELLESRGGSANLGKRYERQLAIERTALAEALGHLAADGVAFVAGDPYFREGTDVALLFKLKNGDLLRSSLDRFAASATRENPGAERGEYDIDGVKVSLLATADRAVCQHRFELDGVLTLANSRPLVERLIRQAKAPQGSLASSPDFITFRTFWPHDSAEDGFAFLSDAFVLKAISPRTKVLASRRMLARAELAAVGYGALLYGWLEGVPAATADSIVKAGYLKPEELTHQRGGAIALDSARGASSNTWGHLGFLTPLAELPLDALTESEKTAYEAFRNTYQSAWRSFIDPIGVRITRGDDGRTLTLDARMMPLISESDYNELIEMVGQARISLPEAHHGGQWVFAVGDDARLRRELDSIGRAIGSKDIGMGWLGNWVAVGARDTGALWDALMMARTLPEPPKPPKSNDSEEPEWGVSDVDWEVLMRLPIWVGAQVKNPLALGTTLTALRTLANQAAPDLLEWGDAGKYRDVTIVRIRGKNIPGAEPGLDKVGLHYATAGDAFVASLDIDTLKWAIDSALDGKFPKVLPKGAEEGPQTALVGAPRPGGVLTSCFLALAELQARPAVRRALRDATALARGLHLDPASPAFATAARGYLGYEPGSPHGGKLLAGAHGNVAHSIYGSELEPAFPPLPVPESPATRWAQGVSQLKLALGFEGTGVMRGLRATFNWTQSSP